MKAKFDRIMANFVEDQQKSAVMTNPLNNQLTFHT